METIVERAGRIVRDQLGLRREDVLAPEMTIAELGADSLDCVEIVIALEEEFECAIPDAAAERWRSFGDVVAFLSRPPIDEEDQAIVSVEPAHSGIWLPAGA